MIGMIRPKHEECARKRIRHADYWEEEESDGRTVELRWQNIIDVKGVVYRIRGD